MKLPAIDVIIRCIYGEFLKFMFKCKILRPYKQPLNLNDDRDKKLIVSLTSYGRRVQDVAPYAIMSIMRQKFRPDHIVLWLDNDNWDDNKLPNAIKNLQNKGLCVRYCDDIRSYKKLIPALEEYSEDLIFTVDDDIFYPSDLLEKVMMAYNNNPDKIYAVRGYNISQLGGMKIAPYNTWIPITKECSGKNIFPTGGAGCLYQKRLLHKDITNVELFTRLAPNADDVWFFFMEYLAGATINILDISKRDTISIDSFYQYFHGGSNLASSNCGDNQNDVQIYNVMHYYNIKEEDLLCDSRNNN